MDTTLADPLLGRVLDGRYRILARVARGGMATVYRAVDARLDRPVAVKVMHPGLADDEDFVARFIREARSAARLSHPNVVAVYDQGTDVSPAAGGPDRRTVFLVMEYVAGRTLRDHLRNRGRLSDREALAVMDPVLAALSAAHSAGLVHRDVKPENVLLADDGQVKVADFGLARAVEASSLTATRGLLIGTVAYLAPEQVEHGTADPRTDVYAAGILLYEMVTGRPPYDGDTPLAVAYRHVHDDVPAPSRQVPGLSPRLDGLVAAATARDPAARPADARAMRAQVMLAANALARLRNDLPTVRPPSSPGTDRRRPGGPEPRLDGWYAGGGASAGIGTGAHDTLVEAAAAPASGGAPTTVLGYPPAAHPAATGGGAVAGNGGATRTPGAAVRRRRWGPLIAVVLLLLLSVAAGFGGWWFGVGRYTAAPGVLAMNQRAATAKLVSASLHARIAGWVFSDTSAPGTVAAEQPGPGRRVLRGGTVALTLSRGPERSAVPDLRGQPVAAADAALRARHLRASRTSGWSDAVAAGRIIGTTPAAGTSLRSGSAVVLLVSKGRQPVVVPPVSGLSGPEAVRRLRAAGFVVTTRGVHEDTVPEGDAVTVTPAPGVTSLHGSTVALLWSRGPALFAVPGVKGMQAGQAQAILAAAGFTVRIRYAPLSQLLGPGEVLGQDPRAGAQRPRGTVVTLSVF